MHEFIENERYEIYSDAAWATAVEMDLIGRWSYDPPTVEYDFEN